MTADDAAVAEVRAVAEDAVTVCTGPLPPPPSESDQERRVNLTSPLCHAAVMMLLPAVSRPPRQPDDRTEPDNDRAPRKWLLRRISDKGEGDEVTRGSARRRRRRTLTSAAIMIMAAFSAGVPAVAGWAAPAFAQDAAPGRAAAVQRPAAPSVPVSQHPWKLPRGIRRVCPAKPGQAACMALAVKDPRLVAADENGINGYGPTDLQSAYNLTSASAESGIGATVALVDAFDDPDAESDLAAYRAEYGLPACTTANSCFEKVNENGQEGDYPSSTGSLAADWAGEISLDVDMVSAICPNCHILLVEASSQEQTDLGQSVDTAVNLGALYISNSYGWGETLAETSYDHYYDHPGVVITASSGDGGYGVLWPAASPQVTAVGGTSLLPASNGRGWAEIAWSGAGSGCSQYELAKPSWQTDTGCDTRTVADVSAVANPWTGVAIYDTSDPQAIGLDSGWNVIGGTSASSPIIASVYALAGPPEVDTSPASYPYAHTADLNDIVAGTNDPAGDCDPGYLCNAEPGYDGPTGLGTPNGPDAFAAP